ncbi:MAG: tRNA ((37)-N6)-threonylcarbamoyltransferase complex transferase subunit TsaD, partial [Pseudomonadota bacterium]
LDRPGLEFSFSGLKTAVSLAIRTQPLDDQRRADIARGVQEAIVDVLCGKALRALDQTGLAALVVAGGVGANASLRERLQRECAARGARVYFPRAEFCTDNAAMIALAGLMRLERGERSAPGLAVRARWPLAELRPPKREP